MRWLPVVVAVAKWGGGIPLACYSHDRNHTPKDYDVADELGMATETRPTTRTMMMMMMTMTKMMRMMMKVVSHDENHDDDNDDSRNGR